MASADARLPNSLVAEALAHGRLPQFAGYPEVQREVRNMGRAMNRFVGRPEDWTPRS